MQPDPYTSLTNSLTRAGLSAQRTLPDQLTISTQPGTARPNQGNTFCVSQREGVWYLSTWAPVHYRVPPGQDLVEICNACMAPGTATIDRLPPELVARYQLLEIDDRQYEELFPTEGETD